MALNAYAIASINNFAMIDSAHSEAGSRAPLPLHLGADGVYAVHPEGFIDLTNEQYHGGPGISKTKLDDIAISPLNYWDRNINPNREPREFIHAFAVGDGTHKLVLEPGTFEQAYGVGFDKKAFPDALDTIDHLKQALNERNIPARGSKPELIRLLHEEDPSVQIMALLEAQHNEGLKGKHLIPAVDYKNMLQMLRSVNMHHTAGDLLHRASVEQSFFWHDHNGVLRKCRTDAITFDGQWIVDLKTTLDVSEHAFGQTIAQRRYHVQAAWYLDILRALYGSDAPKGFAFVAAQKTRPFDVAVHVLTEDQIEHGRLLYQRDLALLLDCQKNDYWPGVDGGRVITARLPNWANRELAELAGL